MPTPEDPSRIHHRLGAHPLERPGQPGPTGVAFSVWAPNATAISVVGDWNDWQRDVSPMQLSNDGEWHRRERSAGLGDRYRFAITGKDGSCVEHADPLAVRCEAPPGTASIVHRSTYQWSDKTWRVLQTERNLRAQPLSIYEVHVGSWRAAHGYAELATALTDHVTKLGFTHVELLPVMGHPFGGSWGYQVTSYFAPSPVWGTPDDLKALIDALHAAGIGVILDWVPAHFPTDPWALANFDGTPLYEQASRGRHPDWDTFEFDLTKPQVRSFLASSARYWIEEYHADGLRFDAVASLLYLDYSRGVGEWEPNKQGGNEHLEAVSLLQSINQMIHDDLPGTVTIAEESTAWPGVSAPVASGGLGFGFKWDLGWMHDTLRYLREDPVHRRHHHKHLTFAAHYATSERFVLPLSHDEVVHGKGALLKKMPGTRPQQLANLRVLLAWMWAHPGKQLLFMGAEIATDAEWDHDRELNWDLLADPAHAGIAALVGALNESYRALPALWSQDHADNAHRWLLADAADENVAAFVRIGVNGEQLVCVANFADTPRPGQRIGLPQPGTWQIVCNSDDARFGGSGTDQSTRIEAGPVPAQGEPNSALVDLVPLCVLWLEPVSGQHPLDQ